MVPPILAGLQRPSVQQVVSQEPQARPERLTPWPATPMDLDIPKHQGRL